MTETTDGMRRRGREGKADEMVQQRTMTTARARLLKGLALEEQRLEINGIATTVLEGGQGPLMVLLHGGIECGGAYWGPVISRLAESHRLVVPDAPGLGESEPVTRLDAAAFSDWLAALLRSTGRERPTLVAHSLLGSLAARFASQHGDRLRGLVLYGAPAVGPYRLPPGLQVAAIRFGLRPSGRNSERFARWAFLDLDLTRRQDREWYEAFDEYSRSRGAVPHVKRTMRQLIKTETKQIPHTDLQRIGCPTALLWGRHDRMVPLRIAEAASTSFGWPLHVIDDAGHVPHIEQPEAFLRALSEIQPTTGRGKEETMTMSTHQIARLGGGLLNLTPEQLGDLDSRVAGRLLRAGDEGWDDALLVWNGMVATAPALVLQPTSARDVAAAVAFSRDHGLLLSVKGGGHNIAGTAIAERGLTLDMCRMRDVTVDADAKVAHVGSGCLLSDVDQAAQKHGLATPLGFISEVGVAGLTLGGGLGYLTRRFGWTVDNLAEVEIVTADGEIRTANRDENADLFWALRGGGGNFGVVTRFTFRMHEVGPTVYGGLIAWPFERAGEILGAYRTITSEAPRELAVWLILLQAPPAPFVPEEWHGQRICAMAVCYSGDLDDADEVLAPIRALGDPVVDLLSEQPYTQVQSYLDDGEPKGHHYYWKTEYATELSDDLLSTVRDQFAECPIPGAELGFLHIGGALNEHDEDDGAVGNRDARYVIGANGMWDPDEPDAAAFRQWIRDAWERQRPFSTGRTYINFQTADEDDERVRATYGANFDRLREVKKAYDPGNLFRVNRNIPPDA